MKLIKHNPTVASVKSFPGVVECCLKHDVSNTEIVDFKLTAKPFTRKMWDEMVSFFRWGSKEYNSEVQGRLFYHPERGEWTFWPFPQKARTGMTAIELPETKETQEQLLLFQGQIQAGSAHSHHRTSAFQSGTDEKDERSVEGVHITIGEVDKKQVSIDSRWYLGGCKFEFDLSTLFDIGDERRTLLRLLPAGMRAEASKAMAIEILGQSEEVPFPDIWKQNVMEVRERVIEQRFPHLNNNNHFYYGGAYSWSGNMQSRGDEWVESLVTDPMFMGESRADSIEALVEAIVDPMFQKIYETARKKFLDYDDMDAALTRAVNQLIGQPSLTDINAEKWYGE